MALTVEVLTLELARAIEPLQVRLVGGQVEELFAELGLPSPGTVLGAPGVTRPRFAIRSPLKSGSSELFRRRSRSLLVRCGRRVTPRD